jgi:hypothetical protein
MKLFQFFRVENSPQFAAIRRNSPQFAAIRRNSPQFA